MRNKILDVVPINFWNINHPVKTIGHNRIEWKSITTGGVAGLIIKLEEPFNGTLNIETVQQNIKCEIDSIGLDPQSWECGGLKKMIKVYRLPDQLNSFEYSFSLPLENLHKGDNPIYIRMTQEDGHMAWSSPIYLIH